MRRRIALWAVVLSLLMCTACQPSQSIIGKPTEQTKTMPECDKKLTIHMNGNVNSLNAATAASIIMWELTK